MSVILLTGWSIYFVRKSDNSFRKGSNSIDAYRYDHIYGQSEGGLCIGSTLQAAQRIRSCQLSWPAEHSFMFFYIFYYIGPSFVIYFHIFYAQFYFR